MSKLSVLFNNIKWGLYSIRVKLFGGRKKSSKNLEKSMASSNLKQTGFLIALLIFPIVQFVVFYVVLNFNSILLAFQKSDGAGGLEFAGFETFARVIDDIFKNGSLVPTIKRSGIQFSLGFFIGLPLSIMVSYAVFKKIYFSGTFKILLFLPNMISSMVFVVCAEYLIRDGFPVMFGEWGQDLLFADSPRSFWTILFFGFWMQFPSGLVIYLGAMTSISNDVMEYCELEGLSTIRELWSIVIPLIYPTIITYIVVAIAGFFTNQGFFFSFMGEGTKGVHTEYDNLGYWFFVYVARNDATISDYTYASAGGLLFTMILAPITFIVKYLLEKFGPKED